MCQSNNTNKISQVRGSILFTTNKIPVFMPGLHIKENNNSIVANHVAFGAFQQFCRYAGELNLFAEGGNQVICDFATLKALYTEFEEMEQNQSLTALLFRNKIYPSAPEVKALNTSSVNGRFNIWLKKCRRMFKIGIRRLLFPMIVTGN